MDDEYDVPDDSCWPICPVAVAVLERRATPEEYREHLLGKMQRTADLFRESAKATREALKELR